MYRSEGRDDYFGETRIIRQQRERKISHDHKKEIMRRLSQDLEKTTQCFQDLDKKNTIKVVELGERVTTITTIKYLEKDF